MGKKPTNKPLDKALYKLDDVISQYELSLDIAQTLKKILITLNSENNNRKTNQ